MDIAPLIGRIARGRHGARDLTQREAESVFSALLKPDADPMQIGAFLIAQRMKGESSAELAGFVQAARDHIDGFGAFKAAVGAVDLPCYAGKRRGPHAALIAAIRMREAGVPILVHGVDSIEGRVTASQVLADAGIKRAASLQEAEQLLKAELLAYIDLSDISPELNRLLKLRSRLGVRSFVNTVARMLNPLQCDGQLNGVFHTPYADYMAAANRLLGQPRSLVFMGAEGEPELYANRQKIVLMQQDGEIGRVSLDDAGGGAYPRERCDPVVIRKRFNAMIGNGLSEWEAATVARMEGAILWASSGRIPGDWKKEVSYG